ncbi:RNA-directed DNA polymerase from mobile element jockey [Chionoecetes opilio]|uniref:RNA-directed DNA polymerase from mobile element jockey n=1 Tax=Chionoecetes opilio TaxID=41210 RepID=A0A8J4XSA9_CHIOP|nr:RNA-directed DNA polymerase from mobile element jockey [Chionoecetes opilio]
MWQVKFASHKTQLLNVSRSGAALRLKFNGDTLAPQDEVEVLGVIYDSSLTFRTHIEWLARVASGKLTSLRRMSWLLNSKELEILYKAQVCSSLDYACLAWGGTANKHLAPLDKVQVRAVRIIKDNNAGQEPHLTTLQH